MKISIEQISYTYPGGSRALDRISLDIEPGTVSALMGGNGAGKTTLARHLNGLLTPDRGRITLGGTDTRGIPAGALAARTAYMFQNPDDQLFSATVDEEVRFGPLNLGYDNEDVDRLVDTALSLSGLTARAQANPADLPRSQKRLCCLAGVVAMDSDCYILDEPTQGLDQRDTRRVEEILGYLSQKNKTIIIITHDPDFAAEQASYGIVLNQGRLAAHDRLDRIFSRPGQCRKWGVQAPQMARLGRALDMDPLPLTPGDFVNQFEKKKYHEQK
ncbi:MAG: ABC transporter ATP-binding protein [Desulfobacter sp.]|nr:MAG: ABC transporter ATP-binding protein [Desulfobacter sp.]